MSDDVLCPRCAELLRLELECVRVAHASLRRAESRAITAGSVFFVCSLAYAICAIAMFGTIGGVVCE